MKPNRKIQLFVKAVICVVVVLVMIVIQFGWGLMKVAADTPNAGVNIIANISSNKIIGQRWPLGVTVTLTVDDMITLEDTSHVASWNPNMTVVEFDLLGIIDLKPGQVLKMSGGTIEKTLTLVDFGVYAVDITTDIVSGIAPAGTVVSVSLPDTPGPRTVTADDEGYWFVNFSDINHVRGISGSAAIDDMENDRIKVGWQNFSIMALKDEHDVRIGGWPAGALLTMSISGPNLDYTDQAIVEHNCCSSPTVFYLPPSVRRLQTGDVITVEDEHTQASYTVSPLEITNVDIEADTISGNATPGNLIEIWTSPELGSFSKRYVMANESGYWLANFHVAGDSEDPAPFDLQEDSSGQVREFDKDGNQTGVNWCLSNPYIEVNTTNQWIHAHEEIWGTNGSFKWPRGTELTLTVDDPTNGDGADYTGTATMEYNPDNPSDPNDIRANFDWPVMGLQPGYKVKVSGNGTEKTLIIPPLQVTEINLFADTITGIASPNAEVYVNPDGGEERVISADSSGNWIVDFGEEQNGQPAFNLVLGSTGTVWVTNTDGDRIEVRWGDVPQCLPGNTITGTVFEHDGITPVPFANIQFENFDTGEALFTTVADQHGQYACYLSNGDYRVQAWKDYYSSEYYNEATDVNSMRLNITAATQLVEINFTISPLPYVHDIVFNLQDPLLQDPAIRYAIAFSIDRQRIIREASLPNGNYGIETYSMVPREHWASAPASDLDQYPFDPVQARAMLDAAGWIDRDADDFRENTQGEELAFSLKSPNSLFRRAMSAVVQQNLEDIGIRVIPEYLFWHDLFTALDRRDFDLALLASIFEWGGSRDSEPYLGEYVSGAPYNYASYSNPAYDTAIANARSATGDAGKLPYLFEAQRIFMHDLPILPLFAHYFVSPVTTPAGNNITVSPETYLDIHFAEVTQGGVTSVLATNINPSDLPPNFQLLGKVYDIGSNAQFTSAQSCFSYDDTGLTLTQESAIRLLHLENNTWVDVTDNDYPDTINNVVCGTVTSFSPFVVMFGLNQPPQITSITAPVDPKQIGQTVVSTVAFNDPDIGDSHTVLWDWGDGMTSTLPATPPTVSAFHNYASPGVYTITVTVTDAGGESDIEIFQYVVIYDPNGGYVTGGGWINSSLGAYTPDPILTGKATFGFVSKYQKGASVPTGNTEFQFHVANMNFKSTSYDWLVIAGSKAQYKGAGTINGAGEYKFILTAIDGTPDKFRIKIWDKITGDVIYDNQLGASDTADPTTVIQGGSIVIHKAK